MWRSSFCKCLRFYIKEYPNLRKISTMCKKISERERPTEISLMERFYRYVDSEPIWKVLAYFHSLFVISVFISTENRCNVILHRRWWKKPGENNRNTEAKTKKKQQKNTKGNQEFLNRFTLTINHWHKVYLLVVRFLKRAAIILTQSAAPLLVRMQLRLSVHPLRPDGFSFYHNYAQ